ncbi:unnamed protein product [Closterium sp. NIES-64]|nr:unnamed protein product [Closterium sp. NIES-64]
MACLHINSLPEELLIAVFWPSKRLFSREPFDEDVWAAVRPPPRFNSEDPDEACYQQSETMFPAPPLPPAFADAAYNLLIASTCRRWRCLARRHVSTLLVKSNRAVSLKDLAAAVDCFPKLTHLHLSDGSAQAIDDTFLARLAACCPNLTAFHLGRPIVENPESDQAGETFLTPAGFDVFFRRCTRLEHLSLACLHCEFRLPSSLFKLVHLRSLTVADLPVCDDFHTVPDDTCHRMPCLHELSIDASGTFFDVPEQATALTRLRTLKLENCTVLGLPDSFGQMPTLTTLVLHNLNTHFPGSCSRLQSLETLIVTDCAYLRELPDPLSALTALKTLCLADSPLLILPDDIGGLTNLHTLYLKSYRARHLLPPSFTRLASLTRLELHKCELAELPEAMGELTRLRELYVLSCSWIQRLPESVSALLNLEVLVVDKCSSLFSVPTSLMHLSTLKQLELSGCALLRKAPEFLPGSLETLRLGTYPEVTHLPGIYALSSLKSVSLSMVIFPSALSRSLSSLEHLRLVLACEGELPFPLADLPRLRTLALVSTGVVKLPDFSTSTLQELRQLEICLPELTEIPSTIAALQKLTNLEINAPKLRALLNSIGALSRLCKLIMSNCLALTHLPASLTQLACLRELTVHKAAITSLPPNFARLSRLQALDLEGCKQLEALPGDMGKLELLDRVAFTGGTEGKAWQWHRGESVAVAQRGKCGSGTEGKVWQWHRGESVAVAQRGKRGSGTEGKVWQWHRGESVAVAQRGKCGGGLRRLNAGVPAPRHALTPPASCNEPTRCRSCTYLTQTNAPLVSPLPEQAVPLYESSWAPAHMLVDATRPGGLHLCGELAHEEAGLREGALATESHYLLRELAPPGKGRQSPFTIPTSLYAPTPVNPAISFPSPRPLPSLTHSHAPLPRPHLEEGVCNLAAGPPALTLHAHLPPPLRLVRPPRSSCHQHQPYLQAPLLATGARRLPSPWPHISPSPRPRLPVPQPHLEEGIGDLFAGEPALILYSHLPPLLRLARV